MMRTALAIAVLVLTPDALAQNRAQDGAPAEFVKLVEGRWSRLPVPPLADFGPPAVAAALVRCGTEDPDLLGYARRDGQLVRGEGSDSAIVLDAKPGSARSGFRQWLVLRTDGPKVLLIGALTVADVKQTYMLTDEASYVRCPEPEKAEPEG